MDTTIKPEKKELTATARQLNASISTKQSVEISYFLRYRSLRFAKEYLQQVIVLKKAIPFQRFTQDTGHKKGLAAGRFPQKAAAEFLRLLISVEANAQAKGMNTASLKITKLIANKAAIPLTGGRGRHATKRTHLDIEVQEGQVPKKKEEKKT